MKEIKIINEWWQEELYNPYRYKILYGGRGSGKSWAVADAIIIKTLLKKTYCFMWS